jgi:F-type H+-transporting ATPase subunit delta
MAQLKQRYGAALFELSLESGMLKEHMEQAAFVGDTIKNGRLESFLEHPETSDAAKRELVQSLFGQKVSGHLMGFLYLMIAKKREAYILDALEAFREMANRHNEKTRARVVSAATLSPEQISELAELLSRKLNKTVEIVPEVDPELIGGLYIHMEDGRLIDRTVRTRLRSMKESIKREGAK